MKRAALLRKTPMAQTSVHPNERQCAGPNCEQRFEPRRMEHTVCSPRCLIAKRKADEKAARDGLKTRKAALESIADLMKVADRAFAAWVRARDRLAGHACISSGRPLDWTGNQVDAGHYRSRGAASHLRYHPDNCHAQSKGDNLWKSGNVVEYRIRLIQRIGLDRVEALETDNHVHHWTKDELRAIAATYRAKLRDRLKAEG